MKSKPLNLSNAFFGILFLLFSFNAFSQVTIDSEDFEGGWGIWNSGGVDCYLDNTSKITGTNSIGIQDNSSTSLTYTNNIDFTPYTSVDITFDFRMVSFEAGEDLSIQYSDNGGVSWSGNLASYAQGAGYNNDTNYTRTVSINTGSYNFSINSRFRFVGGGTWNGDDVYIDNILIEGYLPSGPEINITGLGNTITTGDITPSTVDDTHFGNVDITSGVVSHTFTIENLGSVNNLTLDNPSPYVVITGDTADFTLTANPTTPITPLGNTTFTITFNPTSLGTKTATISIANNDTTGGEDPYIFNVEGVGSDLTILCGTTIATFPYTEDFENTIGDWTQDTGDDIDWTNQTGGTPSNNTGPSGAASGSYYLYTEASGNPSSTANIESPCFNLTGTTNPRATFFYHMFGADIAVNTQGTGTTTDDQVDHTNSTSYIGTLNIDISTDGGATYPTNLWTYTGYIQVDELSSWIPLSFDLSAYIGQTVKFRIQGITSSDYRSDIAIDNFTVTDKPNPVFAPGGVTADLSIWLKANDGHSYTDGQSVSLWQDQGVASDVKVHTAGQEPTYKDNAISNVNFNSVIEFDNSYSTYDTDLYFTNDLTTNSQFLTADYGLFTQEMFIVLIPDDTPITNSFGFMDVYCADSNLKKNESDATGIGFGYYTARINGEIIAYAHSTFNQNEAGDGYAVAEIGTGSSYTNIGIINTRNNTADSQQELYYNANDIETDQNDVAEYMNSNDARYWLGRSEGWESSLNARVVEVISYSARKVDTDLTQERNRIQSYLAIKYGITLGINGTSQDYVDSDGTVIWDINTGVPANDTFNYNITGIGRDDASELNQKQSKTVNTSDDITIGLTDIYTTNNLNVNTFATDKSFLVWGNDNGALAAQPDITVDMSSGIAGLVTEVTFTAISRTWKVVETGTVGKTKIAIPTAMLSATLSPPGDYLMFISNSPTFSPTSEYRVMAANGTNLETSYDFNGTKYITFGYAPEYTFVRSIQFDGAQDYLDAGDVLDLNPTAFTISAWIKRENTSASIVSKRDNAYSNGGYDFSINASGNLEMSWKNGTTQTITSSVVIPTGKWHHVAVIYDGTNAKLYIDGVEDTAQTTALSAPIANTESFLIAAADGDEASTTAFFNGNIDEVRIWNVALTEAQLRYIMNQEIEDNAGNINGTIIPQTITKNEVSSIPWTSLQGYYPMSTYTFTNCKDASGNGNIAALKNLNTVDHQTAPLPYVSTADGAWDTAATWLNNTVQDLPNSFSIIDGTTPINWNIVEINNNITIKTNATLGREREVLALMVNSNKLTVSGTTTLSTNSNSTGTGNGLTVTHYLGLDGKIDLEGESQLIQTTDSDLVVGANGELERDQQGTGNIYRYNDWSSPVQQWFDGANYSIPVSATFNIAGVLRDGTTSSSPQQINFIGGYDGINGNPISIANYWLYVRNDNPDTGDIDANWRRVGSEGIVNLGEGFLMKGTGSATDQNYVFQGKPNNGDITVPVVNDNDFLVGNPYPSAIDANKFITDNAGAILGTIYFWDHFGGNSHNLADYEAGYATYNLIGGALAPNLPIHNLSTSGTKIPGRYIAVGQAFYVDGDGAGNKSVVFNNSQRVFVKEDGGTSSVFMKPSKNVGSSKPTNKQVVNKDTRTKFRIGFNAPNGGHRQLLLGFDERASDNVDYGFDGLIFELNKNDMFWEIDSKRYVIQGTNKYSLESEFPLGIILKEEGLISIEVDALENVEEDTKLYIKDKLTGETYNITNQAFEINLEAGEYVDRFVLAFQPRLKTLGEIELFEGISIYMNNTSSEIQLNRIIDAEILDVSLFNYLGQQIRSWNTNLTERLVALPIQITTGAYIVKVTTNAGVITKKIIIE